MSEWEYLRNIPIFEELAPADLAIIDQVTIERRYKKNMIIFMEGEPGEGFHYIKRGKVKIAQLTQDGREHIINILGPGEVFAEVLLFNRGTYPATAVAIEDSLIGMIKNSELEKVVTENSRIALQIIRVMSKKLLQAQKKIKTLALSDTFSRTAQILTRLSQQYGQETGGGVQIAVDMTRQDLANLVGTTRETMSRVLSSLKKDKVIDFADQQIIIVDKARLDRYLDI